MVVRRSTIAWAMSMRSNGSRWMRGSAAAVAACSNVISSNAIPDALQASSNDAAPPFKMGATAVIGFFACLSQSSQAQH